MLFTIALDQWSKQYFFNMANLHGGNVKINQFLNIVTLWNKGVSFGLFGNMANVNLCFTILSSVIVLILLYMLKNAQSSRVVFSYSLLIGGAIGNLIDRLRFGAVADFIDVHLGAYHWPAFNVADSAICISVIILAIFCKKQ